MKINKGELLEKLAKTKFFYLSALLLFVPLLVITKGAYPYVFYKTLVVEFLAVASFFVYLFLAVGNWEKYKPRFNWLSLSLFAWLVWMVVTSIFGSNWQISWWGDWQRSEGLILIVTLLLWLISAQSVFSKSDWQKLLKVSVGVSGLIALMAFIQAAGTSINFLPVADRVSSTLGNAAFLATYCLWHIGLAMVLFFNKETDKRKYIYLLVALLNLVTLFLTGTRSAVVGLVIGLIPVVVYLLIKYFRNNTFKSKNKVTLAVVLVIIILLAAAIFYKKIPGSEKVQRLFDWSSSSITAQTRLIMWKTGALAALEKPVFGYGYENYEPIFDKHAPARYYQLVSTESWVSRAHNIYVDNLVYGGFVGLALYLVIWLMVAWKLWQKWLQDKSKEVLVLASLIIAYLAQNIFIFDSVSTFIILFLVFGYIGMSDRSKTDADSKLKSISLIIMPILIVVTLFFGYWQIQVWRVGIKLHQVTKAITMGRADVAKKEYQEITKFGLNSWNANVAIVEVLAKTVSANGVEMFNQDELKTFVQSLDKDFEKYLINNWRAQIDFYYQRNLIVLSEIDDNEQVKVKLLNSLAESRKKYPNNSQFIWSQITASLVSDKVEDAKMFVNEAIEKFPENKLGYWFASIIAFDEGRESDGYKYATEAINRGYELAVDSTWQKLYDYYYDNESWFEMELLMRMYINQDPDDYDGYINLADVMVKQGKISEAKEMLFNKIKTDKASTDDMFKKIQMINQVENYEQATTTTK